METHQDLQELITKNIQKIEKALLQIENRKRINSNQKPFPDDTRVFLAVGPNANLLYLNLRVWSIRYCVSLEFILETLLDYFSFNRGYSRKRTSDEVRLGIPANLICGIRSRQILEDTIIQMYPDGENFRQMNQKPKIPIKPVKYDSLREMVSKYSKRMEKRQLENTAKERIYKRKFRQENQPNFKR